MKKVLSIVLVIAILFMTSGCNQQIIDTTYYFDEAIIELPDGTIIRGEVETWKDMIDYPEQIQIVIDGTTYLTHMSNVVLIANNEV